LLDLSRGPTVQLIPNTLITRHFANGRNCSARKPCADEGGVARSRVTKALKARSLIPSAKGSQSLWIIRLGGRRASGPGPGLRAALHEKVRARVDDMLGDRIELARVQLHHVLILDVVGLVDELLELQSVMVMA